MLGLPFLALGLLFKTTQGLVAVHQCNLSICCCFTSCACLGVSGYVFLFTEMWGVSCDNLLYHIKIIFYDNHYGFSDEDQFVTHDMHVKTSFVWHYMYLFTRKYARILIKIQIVKKASRKIGHGIVVTDTGRRKANSCFYRSCVRGIYCWSVQKGKVLHIERNLWPTRRFPNWTRNGGRDHGNMAMDCTWKI